MGFPPFLGLGAKAPVIAVSWTTFSSTNPFGTPQDSPTRKPKKMIVQRKSQSILLTMLFRMKKDQMNSPNYVIIFVAFPCLHPGRWEKREAKTLHYFFFLALY
jgi:hypothetical protein